MSLLRKALHGAAEAGVRIARDQNKENMLRDRQARAAEYNKGLTAEQRTYDEGQAKQKHGQKLTDAKNARDAENTAEEKQWQRNNTAKVKAARLKALADKDSKKKESSKLMIKSVTDGLGEKSLVQVNKDGTYTRLKSTDEANNAKMSREDAASAADREYSKRASMFSSDDSQFGMSEQKMKDIWTDEFSRFGRPITGVEQSNQSPQKGLLEQGVQQSSTGTITAPHGTADGTYSIGGKTVTVTNGMYKP